jgi:hypothetical protein
VTGGGDLAGGELLLAGATQSGVPEHHSTSKQHREIEEGNADSLEPTTEARRGGGRRATSNGGRRSTVNDDKTS